MNHPSVRACFGLALAILCVFSTVSVAQADGPVATLLTISPLEPFVVGKNPTIIAHLTDAAGKIIGAVDNEVVYLFVDGVKERRVRTDSTGTATFSIRRDLSVGTYNIRVVYEGTRGLQPSSASAELEIVPAEVEIHTIPPLPGISFSLEDRIFTSDEAGTARIKVEEAGVHALKILTTEKAESDMRAEFIRWSDEVFAPAREVIVPMDKTLEVGFEVSYQASQTFVDLSEQPVDPARITSLTIKGSNGVVHTFDDGQPRWLPTGRVVRRSYGLEETKILYSVMSVIIDGTNVVNKAQQRFFVHPNDVWQISLLLYSAHFTAYDALLRFPVGSGILLEYPDGRSENFSFGPDDDIEINSLARGPYTVTVTGASGMAPPTPLAMSRNQTVELLVFSRLDMAVMLGSGVALALGLLFFGRPYLFTMLITLPGRLLPKRRLRRVERTLVFESVNTPPALRQCKFCQATIKQVKAGLNRSGSQRYRCQVCNKVYTPAPNPIGYPSEIRVRAVQMYIEGNTQRSIGRALDVSPQTVASWVASDIKLPPIPEPLETPKLDEQYAIAS